MTEEIKAVEQAVEGFQAKLDGALAKMQEELKATGKVSVETTGRIDELTHQVKESDAKIADLEQKAAQGFGVEAKRVGSIGEQYVGSEEFKNIDAQRGLRMEVKNTISGLTGSPEDSGDILTQSDRLPGIYPGAFRSLRVLDVIPVGQTNSNIVEYTYDSSWTNAAAEAQEKGAKAESTLDFALRTDNVRTIAHFIKASNQVLADAPLLRSYIDRRLSHGLRNRLETQVIAGNGTAPNISGLTDSGRFTAFTPTTGDGRLDSLNRAKYAIEGSDFMASHIFMNPATWGAIERTKTGISGDVSYAAGEGAALSYINNGMTPTVWGLPVVLSNNVTADKLLVLDVNACMIAVRQGVTIETGFVGSDFTNNLVTIRAEMRAAFSVFEPLAVRYGDLTV